MLKNQYLLSVMSLIFTFYDKTSLQSADTCRLQFIMLRYILSISCTHVYSACLSDKQ